MASNPITVTPHTTLSKVRELMQKENDFQENNVGSQKTAQSLEW
jgi:hypothetical protein